MGSSHWKPLPPDVTGAARELAELLRSTVDQAGLTLRRLAAENDVPYSLTTLHRYFSGRSLPPLLLIKVVSRKCDSDGEELRVAYEQAHQAAVAARRTRTSSAAPGPAAVQPPQRENVATASRWWARPRSAAPSPGERPLLAAAVFAVSTVGIVMLATTLLVGLDGDGERVPATPVLGAAPPGSSPSTGQAVAPTPSASSPDPDKSRKPKPEPSTRNVAHTEPDRKSDRGAAERSRQESAKKSGEKPARKRDSAQRPPNRPKVAAAGHNLVKNGTFTGTTRHWWGNGVGLSVDRNRLRADVPGGSGTQWDKMAGYSIFPLRSGGSYVLRFDAKADANITIRVTVQHEYEPYTKALVTQVDLSRSMRTFSYRFGSGFNSDRGIISVQVGGHGGDHTVWLDNVSLARR